MRRAAKVDKNQTEIVAALRAAGASVVPLHAVGNGCPDLLVGYGGKNLLIEVKDETGRAVNKGRDLSKALTKDQHKFHFFWQGQLAVVWSAEEALSLL